MGGIGISIKGAAPTPLTSLPPKVVDAIASKLGISDTGKASLAGSTVHISDNQDYQITRLGNPDPATNSLTIKKQAGGVYSLTYQGTTTDIPP